MKVIVGLKSFLVQQSQLQSRNREDCLAVFESNHLEGFLLLKEGLPEEAIALPQRQLTFTNWTISAPM